MALSNIPDLTMALGVPRLVAVEHPFGQIIGRPGADDRQREVLLGALQAVDEMTVPGSVKHLPFEWPGTAKEARAHPPQLPPIVGHLKRHPWQLPRLLRRNVPHQP